MALIKGIFLATVSLYLLITFLKNKIYRNQRKWNLQFCHPGFHYNILSINFMFIGSPGEDFSYRIEELGGVRLIIKKKETIFYSFRAAFISWEVANCSVVRISANLVL